jgi:transcription antitermination factor NusG
MPQEETATQIAPAPEGGAWIVIHARPRCEKKVAEFCRLQSLPCYLPLRSTTHRYGGRVRRFESPLFPGYVFCVVNIPQRTQVRQSRFTANVLDVLDQAQLVAQLRQVEQAIASGSAIEVMPYLETGRRVRVLSGPLKGLEGIVLRAKGRARIVVNLDMIQQSVAVEVESSLLGPG